MKAKIETLAGSKQVLHLGVRLSAPELFSKVQKHQLWHFKPKGSGYFTAYQFSDQSFCSMASATEFHHILESIVSLSQCRKGSSLAQWLYVSCHCLPSQFHRIVLLQNYKLYK